MNKTNKNMYSKVSRFDVRKLRVSD